MADNMDSVGRVVTTNAGPPSPYSTKVQLAGSYDPDTPWPVAYVYSAGSSGLLAKRPEAASLPWQLCAILPTRVERSSSKVHGCATFAYDTLPVMVAVTDDSDAPAVGSVLGTVANSWKLKVGNYGFICTHVVQDDGKGTGGTRVVYVRPFSSGRDLKVTLSGLSATLPAGGNGTFSQFNGTYSYTWPNYLLRLGGSSWSPSGYIGPNLEPWKPAYGATLSGTFSWAFGAKYFVGGQNADGKWSLHIMIGYYGSYGTYFAYRSSFVTTQAVALPWLDAYVYDVANSGTINPGGGSFTQTAWGHDATASCVITPP